MGPSAAGRERFFFVHIMKTGGTSFWMNAASTFPREEYFPRQVGLTLFEQVVQYNDVHEFLEMTPETRSSNRLFSGHVPYSVARASVPDAVTVTVLRDPVERTLSYLRHCRTNHDEHRGEPLEEIYEDEWLRGRFMDDHQTKVLSMTVDEARALSPDWPAPDLMPDGVTRAELREDPDFVAEVERQLQNPTVRRLMAFNGAPFETIEVDDGRLADAIENLDAIDVVGTTDHLDVLMDVMARRYGWSFGDREVHNRTEPHDAPASLRRRIADDTAADAELYEHARRRADR